MRRPPTIAGLVFALGALFLVFGLIEARWPSIPGQKRLRSGFWTDVAYWFLTPLTSQTVVKVSVIAAVVATALALGVPFEKGAIQAFVARSTWAGTLPVGLQLFLTLFVGDLLAYWAHRLFHGRRLWRFHAVHHASEELDWLSAVRLHPVNEIGTRVAQAARCATSSPAPASIAGTTPARSRGWTRTSPGSSRSGTCSSARSTCPTAACR